MINLKKLLTETNSKSINESKYELTTLNFRSGGEDVTVKFQVSVNGRGDRIVFHPISEYSSIIRGMEKNGLDEIDIATLIAIRVNKLNRGFVKLEVDEKLTGDSYFFTINLKEVLNKMKL